MIEYTHIIPNVDGNEGWVTLVGHQSEGESVGYVYASFPIDALQWRAVEYGIPEDDLDTLFKMVFSEILTVGNQTGVIADDPRPYDMDAKDAWAEKKAYMAGVSGVQKAAINKNSRTISVDRSELVSELESLLPGGTISGKEMEEKKIMSLGIRTGDPEEELAAQFALEYVKKTGVNNAEGAMMAGWAEVESRIAGGISQDELILQHELQMLEIQEQMESGQADGEESERSDRAESGEPGGGSEGEAERRTEQG